MSTQLPLQSNKARCKSASSQSVHTGPSVKEQSSLDVSNASTVNEKRKTKSHYALNDSRERERYDDKLDHLNGEQSDQNLIRILSQNIIELTENLNLLFGNEPKGKSTKSTESDDNDLIEKIDQLKQVSRRLKDCTTDQLNVQQPTVQQPNVQQPNVQQLNAQQPNVQQSNVPSTKPINQTTNQSIQQTKLADLNLVEQVEFVDHLHVNRIEPEFAEHKSTAKSDHLDKVQIHQQIVEQPIDESVIYDENNNQFNEQTKDKRLKQINKQSSPKKATRLEEQQPPPPPQQDESQEDDEFFECTDEQKELRKNLFKGSKLNLEQLIDKAIDEQLLGQWLKLSDSIDNEDGPVQQKHSIEELKHKFATKLAIIHYKLYQKYSKNCPIKKWRHRKLNKYNKIQSKYTLLQGLMDDGQFIQFLMDKINYFMRKIRQCKTQRKELKKGLSKLDLDRNFEFYKDAETDQAPKAHFEFDKSNLSDESPVDENNNQLIGDKEQTILDANNNEVDQGKSTKIEQEELDRPDEIKNEEQLFKELNEEIIKDLNEQFDTGLEIEQIKVSSDLDQVDQVDDREEKKRRGLSRYTILFIFTLIIFMILIVLFRWTTISEVKKCTNCARHLDSNQLMLKPVNQLRQSPIKYPACDHRIILEAQKLLGPRN